MVWNGSSESCVENRSSSTPVALEEASEKFTPAGEGVAPNGWGDPASTRNLTSLSGSIESVATIVFSPCGSPEGTIAISSAASSTLPAMPCSLGRGSEQPYTARPPSSVSFHFRRASRATRRQKSVRGVRNCRVHCRCKCEGPFLQSPNLSSVAPALHRGSSLGGDPKGRLSTRPRRLVSCALSRHDRDSSPQFQNTRQRGQGRT